MDIFIQKVEKHPYVLEMAENQKQMELHGGNPVEEEDPIAEGLLQLRSFRENDGGEFMTYGENDGNVSERHYTGRITAYKKVGDSASEKD